MLWLPEMSNKYQIYHQIFLDFRLHTQRVILIVLSSIFMGYSAPQLGDDPEVIGQRIPYIQRQVSSAHTPMAIRMTSKKIVLGFMKVS